MDNCNGDQICDKCGKKFLERPRPVYDENWKIQPGLISCNKCSYQHDKEEAPESFRTIFNDYERDLLAEAVQMYANRCKVNGSRKMMGEKATEYDKRRQWQLKAQELQKLADKLLGESF